MEGNNLVNGLIYLGLLSYIVYLGRILYKDGEDRRKDQYPYEGKNKRIRKNDRRF